MNLADIVTTAISIILTIVIAIVGFIGSRLMEGQRKLENKLGEVITNMATYSEQVKHQAEVMTELKQSDKEIVTKLTDAIIRLTKLEEQRELERHS